jgi:hypothetical protein
LPQPPGLAELLEKLVQPGLDWPRLARHFPPVRRLFAFLRSREQTIWIRRSHTRLPQRPQRD